MFGPNPDAVHPNESIPSVCYLNGRGVEQNRDEARKWFQKGADAGNTSCEYYLKQMDQGSI